MSIFDNKTERAFYYKNGGDKVALNSLALPVVDAPECVWVDGKRYSGVDKMISGLLVLISQYEKNIDFYESKRGNPEYEEDFCPGGTWYENLAGFESHWAYANAQIKAIQKNGYQPSLF